MWDKIRAVWARELLDTVRDKRTLYMMVLLPIVLMPVIMLLGPVMISRQQEAMQETVPVVAFYGGAPADELVSWLESVGGLAVESGADGPTVDSPAVGGPGVDSLAAGGSGAHGSRADRSSADGSGAGGPGADGSAAGAAGDDGGSWAHLEARLHAGEVDLIVCMDADASVRWAAEEPIRVEIVYSAASSRSITALQRFDAALQGYGRQVAVIRLIERGLSPDLVQPFQVVSRRDISPEQQFTGRMLAMIVPFFIAVWAIAGGMYTAIDAAAGEKERNSLETLVMAPVPTSVLVIGKFLAITTVALIAVVLLIASTTASMLYVLPKLIGEESFAAASVTPASLLWLLLVMALFVALMSAVQLGLSVFSKSYREAQAYMTGLMFAVMLPGMYLMFMEETGAALWTYVVPVLNVLLVARDLLEGGLAAGAAAVIITVASLTVTGVVALWLTLRAFRHEQVIFRT